MPVLISAGTLAAITEAFMVSRFLQVGARVVLRLGHCHSFSVLHLIRSMLCGLRSTQLNCKLSDSVGGEVCVLAGYTFLCTLFARNA